MTVFAVAGTVLLVVFMVGLFTGWLSRSQSALLGAVMNGCFGISAALWGLRVLAMVNAAACAFYLWDWWKRGGGDDTKRRLRSLKGKFTPVRRTAPAGA